MIGAFVGVKYLVNLQNARCNNKDNAASIFMVEGPGSRPLSVFNRLLISTPAD